jgi:hypothetical protein
MTAAASVLMLAPLAVTAAAYLQRYSGFPTLVNFSSPVSTYFLGIYSAVTADRSALPGELRADTGESTALHARVTDSGGWALALWEPIADWRGYEHLNLEVANPTAQPLVLRLRVRDRTQRKNRRSGYQGSIEVAPNSRVVRSVALTKLTSGEGTARVDISQVNSVVIARDSANRAREFYVMRIWLD